MKRKQFQKTLLAMMVSAVAAQVSAVEFDVSTGHNNVWVSQTFNEPVTLVGTRNVVSTQPSADGVNIALTNIQGTLRNDANLTLDASGRAIRGLIVDGALDQMLTTTGSNITGDIIQAGNIHLSNTIWAEGFEVGASNVGGSIINSGNITLV